MRRMERTKERKQYFFVVHELVSRELKRRYSRSRLGILWSVLNPLLSMAVLSMLFSTMFRRSIENYPVYYLTGSLLWTLFSTGTNGAMTALTDNKALLLQVRLPKTIFPLARVWGAFLNLLYSLAAYAGVLPWWNGLYLAGAALATLLSLVSGFEYVWGNRSLLADR